MTRQLLRQGIRELWTAAKSGTRLEQKQAIKKIKRAVEKEEKQMLERISVEESPTMPADEFAALADQLETAEALAEGEPVLAELSPEQLRARELKAAGKSYSYIAREIFAVSNVSAFYINKVRRLLGEEESTAPPQDAAPTVEGKRRGGRPKLGASISETIQPEKGADSRQKVTPNDDGSGSPLTLGNGHTNGNGHSDLVTLSPAQLSKLWGIVTGGELGIQTQGGEVTCWVSESSFKKALPALIDRL
jgi:hypothetical protein